MSTASPQVSTAALPPAEVLGSGRRLAGTRGLAVNGGALIVNVVASGVLGFVFWVVAAHLAEPGAVSRASTAVTAVLAVVSLAQQNFVLTLPALVAVSPAPKQLVRTTYGLALAATAVVAPAYILLGPMLAGGLEFFSDWRIGISFCAVSLLWSIFSLQDAVLTGVRRSMVVLGENTLWGVLRVLFLAGAWAAGVQLGVGWIVAAWALPAAVLVAAVSWYLFGSKRSPIAEPLGTQVFARRQYLTFMGAEYAGSVLSSVVALISGAYMLTAIGADLAAPVIVAATLVLVAENALSSFGQALAVEASSAAGDRTRRRNLLLLTVAFLGGASVVAVVGAAVAGEPLMALLGDHYRVPGGTALAILVWCVPFRAVALVSNADNRIRGEGGKNLLQQVVGAVVCFGLLLALRPDTVAALCWVIVAVRVVTAAVAAVHLNQGRLRPISA